jgi:large subunit ribosomal protein L30
MSEKKMQIITVKQIASACGRKPNQVKTLNGLGLGKIGKIVKVQDNPSIRGMIKTVFHLVQIVRD